MKIWVDADACPVVIREILFKAAERTSTDVTFIANQLIRTPPSKYLKSVQVHQGFDIADKEITQRAAAGDLIITSDIPLADAVIEKGATALSFRGELYTAENIKPLLGMRDFMDTLRSSGIQTGGPSALNQQDRQQFASHLDRWLAKAK